MNGCHIKPEQFFNLIFGYYDRYAEALSNLSATSGANYLLGTVVPAGEVWILTAASVFNATTAAGTTGLGVYDGATYYVAETTYFFTLTRVFNFSGHLIAKAGDKFYASFGSCAAGDDIYVYFLGYKMKVA